MKTYTQLIEELGLNESSLGHKRIGRLAKTGNLSHERLDHYVKKHIKRAGSWGIGSEHDPEYKQDDIDHAKNHVKMQIHRNIDHYNKNKHKAKQKYNKDTVDKHIVATAKRKIKPIAYETDWSDPERPERDPDAPRRTPSQGGHVRKVRKESYVDEMKKTPKIRIKTAIEQRKGGEDSKLAKRIMDYEKERFSEDTLDEISPQVAARAYGARSMRTKVNPSDVGRQKTMDAYKRYTKRRMQAGLLPDELIKDYHSGENKELLKTPDYRIDQGTKKHKLNQKDTGLTDQDALVLRTRKKLEQLKNT